MIIDQHTLEIAETVYTVKVVHYSKKQFTGLQINVAAQFCRQLHLSGVFVGSARGRAVVSSMCWAKGSRHWVLDF